MAQGVAQRAIRRRAADRRAVIRTGNSVRRARWATAAPGDQGYLLPTWRIVGSLVVPATLMETATDGHLCHLASYAD